ncbi:MAG: hypothetical protein EP344_01330 [Bacteroidetes bacterium]|nr:MAG: hypothetical protein EP344_01330 [Bacteroidota bacterium]
MRLFLPAFILTYLGTVTAQTAHPLLLEMQQKAKAVEYGSYRIEAREQYPYSKDTIFYDGNCAFTRYEELDGSEGLKYEVDMTTRYPGLQVAQHLVFDGRMKLDLRNDTLALLYDSRELGEEYILRGLQHFFFIPLLLHEEQTKKYLGPDKYLGTPPYQTLGDTLIGQTACTLVGADWTLDTAGVNWQHLRFGISKASGLPVFFSQVSETRPENEKAPVKKHRIEIRVEEWSKALPIQSFYIDWPGLPPTFEVRHFHDCYNRELLRPRNQPDL